MKSLVARTPVAVLHCRVGRHWSFHVRLGVWTYCPGKRRRVHCPGRTTMLFLGRTARVEVAWWWGRVRGACHLLSSRDPRGAEPSCPRLRRTVLSALGSPPAWHELSVVTRQKGDDGADHASSWAGRRDGEDVLGPSIVLSRRGLLPVL